MRHGELRHWSGLALLLGTITCTPNPAPSGWLSPPQVEAADPYGAWIVVWGPKQREIRSGELLAVTHDSVFLLSDLNVPEGVAAGDSLGATLAFYDPQTGSLSAWTALGTIGTISNGLFLIFTGPIFLITGSVATGHQSSAPIVTVRPGGDWRALAPYARFPGGLPGDLPIPLPPKFPRRAP